MLVPIVAFRNFDEKILNATEPLELKVPGVRCQVSGVRCQVPGVRCEVVRCQVAGVRCQVSGASTDQP